MVDGGFDDANIVDVGTEGEDLTSSLNATILHSPARSLYAFRCPSRSTRSSTQRTIKQQGMLQSRNPPDALHVQQESRSQNGHYLRQSRNGGGHERCDRYVMRNYGEIRSSPVLDFDPRETTSILTSSSPTVKQPTTTDWHRATLLTLLRRPYCALGCGPSQEV
jgi:hypothetical protein